MKLNRYRDLYILFGTLLYKLLLEAVYIIFVVPLFGYLRFNLDISAYHYLMGLSLLIILYFLMPRDDGPASVILQIHLYLIFIPMISWFGLTGASIPFMLWSAAAFLLECLVLRWVPDLKIPRIRRSGFILTVILTLITLAVYAIMLSVNGLSLGALNFDATYELRAGIRFPYGTGYLVPWQGKVINPFLMALGYSRRRRPLLILGGVLQLILFLITAQKAFLFIPFAILGIMWFMKHFSFLSAAAVMAPLFVLGNLLVFVLTGNIYIPSLFIRRALILPAQLKFYWYEFFRANPKLYYSQGTIGSILGIPNPYPSDAANVIGEVMFGRPEMHANAGYVADAYANGGFIGLIAIALVFALILKLIASLGRTLDHHFLIGLVLFHVISLNDGGLVTALVTGGLLFLLLLLYLHQADPELASQIELAGRQGQLHVHGTE